MRIDLWKWGVDAMRRVLRDVTAQSNLTAPEAWLTSFFNQKPPQRGSKELLQAYSHMPWLRAVTERISLDISAIPFLLFVIRDANTGAPISSRAIKRLKFAERNQALADIVRAQMTGRKFMMDGQAIEVDPVTQHPILSLLDSVNPFMEGQSARQVVQAHLDLKGEGYFLIERDAMEMPKHMWPILPHWVEQLPTMSNPAWKLNVSSKTLTVPLFDVIWLKDINPADPYGRGSGYGQALGDELDSDEYAAEHIKAWFYNGARPDQIFIAKGQNKETLSALKHDYESQLRGVGKAHRSFWLGREVEVKEVSHTFSDMELVKLREFERDTIIQVFGVPPAVLGIEDSSDRVHVTAAERVYASRILLPRMERWRASLQRQLVDPIDENLLLHYVSPVPEDKDFILEVARAAPYTRSRDEWRALQDLAPDDNSEDVYFYPFNIFPQPVSQGSLQTDPSSFMRSVRQINRRREQGLVTNDQADQAIVQAMLTFAKNGGSHEVIQGEILEMAVPPAIEKGEPKLAEKDIDRVVKTIDPVRLTSELDPVFEDLVGEWGQGALDDLGVGVSFNLVNPRIADFLNDMSATRITGLVNETTRGLIRSQLSEGVLAGEGVESLKTRIKNVFADADSNRARTIARTETGRAANFSIQEGFKQSGVVKKKEWLTTRDGNERETHAELDGKQVNIDAPFISSSGASAQYPGEFGVAEEDVNCRCTILAIVGDDNRTAEMKDALWKKYDRELVPWERKVTAASRRGFSKQKEDALDAVDRYATTS